MNMGDTAANDCCSDRYQKAFAICSQLALIVSKSSVEVFLMRIAQLYELCSLWMSENNARPSEKAEKHLDTLPVQNTKLEDDVTLDVKSSSICVSQSSPLDEKIGSSIHEIDQWISYRNSESLICDECGKECRTVCLLQRHKNRHANDNPGTCYVCKKVFKKGKYLKNHIKTHLQEKQNKCDFCGKQFWLKWNLTAHLKTHSRMCDSLVNGAHVDNQVLSINPNAKTLDLPCNECGQVFHSKYKLERHLKGHAAEKPSSCEVCNKRFKKLSYLRVHAKIHKERKFVCKLCEKQFTTQGCLNAHMMRHSKQFMCYICGVLCSTKFNLQEHINIHTGEALFPCCICGRKFRQKSVLRNHMRLHNDERPYVCNCCGKRFIQSTILVYHMRTHTGERPYACNECDKRYSKAQLLKEHMRLHSGEKPYSCDICGKCFRLSGSLKKHKRLHTGEMVCWCNVCNKGFYAVANLRTHMRSHTGEKPYACFKCAQRFMYSVGLKNHLESHFNGSN